MLEGLEFIVGDPRALSGKAVLYVNNLGGGENPFNSATPAVVAAAAPSDILGVLESVMPVPDELRETLAANLKSAAEQWTRMMFGHQMYLSAKSMFRLVQEGLDLPDELKEALRAEMSGVPDEKFPSAFHGACLPLVGFDPEAVEKFKAVCDILRGPDVPSISYAGLVLVGYAQLYVASYLLQREKTIAGQGGGRPSAVPNFRDLTREEFLKILDAKVSELMYSQETKGGTDQVFADLKALTSGTYLIKDVVALCKLAETGHPRKLEIMNLYLKRIQCLVQERYELIRDLDKQLAELLG